VKNLDVIDGALVSQPLSSSTEYSSAKVSFTGIWDAGEEPTTGSNLIDGDPKTGVTDGRMHDNNYQVGSVSAQVLAQFESPRNWASISYDVQISHDGSGWNTFDHGLRVSNGSSWELIDSWNGDGSTNVSTQNTESLAFDQIHAVELDITVSGGKNSGEWITAFIEFFNFQLLE